MTKAQILGLVTRPDAPSIDSTVIRKSAPKQQKSPKSKRTKTEKKP